MGETLHNVGVSAVQILVVKFLKGTGGRRNGRIDGDIRQIKSSLCLLDDQRKAFESGYVGRHCNGLAALASYRFHGFVQPLLPPRDHHNPAAVAAQLLRNRSEEHTSELQSLMRISYAVFCLKNKNKNNNNRKVNKHKQYQ